MNITELISYKSQKTRTLYFYLLSNIFYLLLNSYYCIYLFIIYTILLNSHISFYILYLQKPNTSNLSESHYIIHSLFISYNFNHLCLKNPNLPKNPSNKLKLKINKYRLPKLLPLNLPNQFQKHPSL
jgi:hypothetical protein